MRPTAYLGAPRGDGWTVVDRCLSEALVLYDASLNEHGVPAWIAQDPDRVWEPDDVVDHVSRVIETYRADIPDNEQNRGLRVMAREVRSRQDRSNTRS